MIPLNSNLNYEPPQEVIRLWKSTYSLPTIYHGVTLPGLIKTNQYYLHLVGFILVIIGEFYGWYTVSSVSQSYDFLFVVLIFIDLSLVIPILRLNGKIKLIRNKLIVAEGEYEKQQLKNRKSNALFALAILKSVLFGVALVKIFYLYKVNTVSFTLPTLKIIIEQNIAKIELWPLTVTYILVAIIHAFFSSYFIGHWYLAVKVRKGEKIGENILRYRTTVLAGNLSFHEAEARAGTRSHYFTKKTIVINDGAISLAEDTNMETKNSFKLHTWGLLTDKQLDELVWAQEVPALKRELSLVCLKHQLDLMGE